MATKPHGIFSITRHRNKGDEPKKKRSLSTPQDLDLVEKFAESVHLGSTSSSKRAEGRKKSSIFSRILRKGDGSSPLRATDAVSDESQQPSEDMKLKADLDFAHALMVDPAEMSTDLCRVDSEPKLVQTICAPSCFSRAAIKMDKKIHQIYVANNRITTLTALSGSAILSKDYLALKFLQEYLSRIYDQRTTLFQQLDEQLVKFKMDPKSIMASDESVGEPRKFDIVKFAIRGDDDDVDTQWDASSHNLSTENTSEESADEGLTPAEIENIAKQIRKSEGSRFKPKRRGKKYEDSLLHPPPPNPLATASRALMRSHTTVPSNLCLQTSSSMASLHSEGTSISGRMKRAVSNTNLPFNLISLTGQLSWMISEYIDRDTSTYRWATELLNQISRMSVTKATWLNLHQQLRETTELLYQHRGRQRLTRSESAKAEVAWGHLQSIYQAVLLKDSNSETVTVGRATHILSSSTVPEKEKKLQHLSVLLNKKLHLAYICDLILWRAHKVLFQKIYESPGDTAQHQLTDFRIRHMQLRLDQANGQNWSPPLIDWITCWIYQAVRPEKHHRATEDDNYCLNELLTLKKSIKQFQVLTKHLCESEFTTDQYLRPADEHSDSHNMDGSQQHLHCHPHLHHHGKGGHLQDLRPLDAERCSHTYSALVRSVYEHAMADRPLSYFAERALYDIAVELNCTVDWTKRLHETLDELLDAYGGWEQLLTARLDLDFYQRLFESEKKMC